MRRAAKTDSNQQAIVDRLREIGCRVYYIKEPVDLLVGYRNMTIAIEVKTKDGRLTKQQIQFIAEWNGGPVHVVRDPEEAVNLVIEECRGFQEGQQARTQVQADGQEAREEEEK